MSEAEGDLPPRSSEVEELPNAVRAIAPEDLDGTDLDLRADEKWRARYPLPRLSAYVNDYVRRATDDPVTIGRRLESRIEDLVDEIADLRAQLHAPQRSHADDGASVGGVASALSGVPGTTTIAPGYSPPIGGPVTMAKARMEAPTDPDGVYQMTPREPTQKVVAASMDER